MRKRNSKAEKAGINKRHRKSDGIMKNEKWRRRRNISSESSVMAKNGVMAWQRKLWRNAKPSSCIKLAKNKALAMKCRRRHGVISSKWRRQWRGGSMALAYLKYQHQ
jgi:hypothetical protein